ncbi:2TM domain-containing protein [Flavobacteriaceae bacterium S356]|uniref:2TM domain-containing protein n=1 Tax=Asprobacillus argus TaxID=3076534 RepID=A0ABU3LEP1_9FLAO|nr:2TM domain-containing protein [Flavobacteriaceae bacterium S356]
MEIDNNKLDTKYLRAKKRVEDIKGYYIHLAVYIAVNTFISVNKVMNDLEDGESIGGALSDFGTYAVWLFWGIGLAMHTFRIFGTNLLMGKEWEERKVKELMDKK